MAAITTEQALSILKDLIICLFLTHSIGSIIKRTEKSIPTLLKTQPIRQLTNAFFAKKFAGIWYNFSIKKHIKDC